MGFSINIPLYKRDEERRLVWGRATREELDKSNEIMDYVSSKPNFEAWSNDFATRTGGKSYGNCRLQHDSHTAIGKIVEPLSFDDDDKAIDICVKVVDDKAWELVKSSVLTGFSVGGSYGSRWKDEDGIVHYTAIPSEISLCDNPCVGSATIECIKTDGAKEVSEVDKEKETQVETVEKAVETETVEKTAVEIEPKDEPKPEVEKTSVEIDEKQEEKDKEEVEKRDFTAEERKKLADEGKAMPDGSFPIENKKDLRNAIRLAGQAKDKKAAIDFICRRARALGAEDMIPEGWCKADKAVEAEEMTKADCQKEDIFEMVCKAMDKADDSIKEKCGKLFHKMVEKGLYCKCNKCTKAVEGEKAEKATVDTDLNKAVSDSSVSVKVGIESEELTKAMSVIEDLKKGFEAFKSANEALEKRVKELEDTPVAGGAMVATGTMALDKTIGGSVGNPPVANSEADVLKKMISETDSAVLKEQYSKRLATLEMKKVFG